ncbi:hypothetical protein C8R47DRAFT_1000332 [Mycena vitilis]|nr:hypothetical protein C8R47DRAFT_1000332 [Mycena vitilis]
MTHRAHPLEIPEIVAHICSQIVNNQPGRCDLSALARTAKIFQDGALNGIWQWQGTFAHILRLMPPDLWNSAVEGQSVYALELVRPITTADWERPLFYLPRVRTFNVSSSQHLPSQELFESLSSSFPRKHLFPNLRSLTWTHNHQLRSPSLYPYISIVLGPRLNQLDIRAPLRASDLHLLPTIAVKCPELTDIEINGNSWGALEDNPEYRAQLFTNISLFLRGLSRIEKVHLTDSGVDGLAFDHLATISTLKSLRMFDGDGIVCRLSQPGAAPRFTQLTFIALQAFPVEVASDIFSCRPPLAHIKLDIYPEASIESVSDLYRTLAANLPPLALRSLAIITRDTVARYSHIPPVFALAYPLAFPPVLHFHHLTTVTLRNDYAFALDDSVVSEIARAWPHLQSLDLNSGLAPAGSEPPRVTLAALCIFAEHCPALESLGINISALIIPPMDEFVFRRSGLKTLSVSYAPIDDSPAVADFIFAVFPNVAAIYSDLPTSLDPGEGWEIQHRWRAVELSLARKRRGLS